ncbi:MAG: hypothetical protein P4M07_07535 [Xanthobacteraceae bacterium]|nr:hypothetical protein [Xanthobacteraceae bacterium]
MNEQLRFVPPNVEFDPRLMDEIARREVAPPTAVGEVYPIVVRRGVFKGYDRILTPEGGILILYKDQLRNLFLTILRVLGWIVATWIGGRFIFSMSSLSGQQSFSAVVMLMGMNWFIASRKIAVSHSVEIRPDAMIIDGEDVFYAEDVGDNWPELQVKDDDPERMVICGICGTRFVEYMTANRLDKNDRTPEVLAADLKAAMEQLWGRREVTFATAF